MPRKKKEKTESKRMKAFKEKGLIGCFNEKEKEVRYEIPLDIGSTGVTNFDDMSAADRCFEIRDHVIALINSEAIGSPGYQLAIDLLEAIKSFKYYSGMRK